MAIRKNWYVIPPGGDYDWSGAELQEALYAGLGQLPTSTRFKLRQLPMERRRELLTRVGQRLAKSPTFRRIASRPGALRSPGLPTIQEQIFHLKPGTSVGSLGQAEEDVDLVTAVKSIYGTVTDVKPLLEFIGNNPILTVSMLMTVILVGSAVGGYIGAGARAE